MGRNHQKRDSDERARANAPIRKNLHAGPLGRAHSSESRNSQLRGRAGVLARPDQQRCTRNGAGAAVAGYPPSVHRCSKVVDTVRQRPRKFVDNHVAGLRVGPLHSVLPGGAVKGRGKPRSHQGDPRFGPVASGASFPGCDERLRSTPRWVVRRDAIGIPVSVLPSGPGSSRGPRSQRGPRMSRGPGSPWGPRSSRGPRGQRAPRSSRGPRSQRGPSTSRPRPSPPGRTSGGPHVLG